MLILLIRIHHIPSENSQQMTQSSYMNALPSKIIARRDKQDESRYYVKYSKTHNAWNST